MICIFNRKELIRTNNEELILNIKSELQCQKIKYTLKTKFWKTASTLGILDAYAIRTKLNMNKDVKNEFIIYVKKTDYALAAKIMYLIIKRKE